MFLLLIQIFTFPGPLIRFGDKALLRIYEFLGSLCRKSQSLNLTPFLLPSVPPWLLPTTLRSGAGDEEACEARLSAPRLSGGKVSPLKNKLYPFTFQKSTLVFNIGKTYLRLKIQRIQRCRVQSLLPIPGSRHQFIFWERDSWMMPPVSLGRCAVFRTVMRGFWKETCGVRQDVHRYKWERVWKERGSGPVATLALHGLFCYIPSPVEAPTTQLLSKAMAAIHWVLSLCPAPNCMPHGLIAPNSHQYWCFYHHPHLADEEVDLERVSDLPKVTQLLELRAESKPGSEQGSQDPKQEGGRRACVLARWVVAGDTLWPHWVDLRTPEPFLL